MKNVKREMSNGLQQMLNTIPDLSTIAVQFRVEGSVPCIVVDRSWNSRLVCGSQERERRPKWRIVAICVVR
jgi:hypothetical protein